LLSKKTTLPSADQLVSVSVKCQISLQNFSSAEDRSLMAFTQISTTAVPSSRWGRWHRSVLWLNAALEATLKESFRSIASLIFEAQDSRVSNSDQTI
ncbi:hypothetical protein N7505_004161, partial [Penicillium chrysogenum]